jgi:integrase
VFAERDDGPWSLWDWQHWRSRTYTRALEAADTGYVKPYALRHSLASLLPAEGRSVHYVARQLGHAPSMTLAVVPIAS